MELGTVSWESQARKTGQAEGGNEEVSPQTESKKWLERNKGLLARKFMQEMKEAHSK